MKLYLNKTSPYARLALVVAHELGLNERIQLVWTEPWDNAEAFLAVTPLGKIPALQTDDGIAIAESRCVCDYLIATAGRSDLVPTDGDALRRVGLGWGVIDCAFGTVIRRRFKDDESGVLPQRWLAALTRTARALDGDCVRRMQASHPDLADLAIAVAFSYCDFRLPEIAWRNQAPKLAALVDKLAQRPSMLATAPE